MGFNTTVSGGSSDLVSVAILNQIHVDGVFVKIVPNSYAPNVVYRVGDGTVHPEGWDNVLGSEYLDFYMPYLDGTGADDYIKAILGAYSVDPIARNDGNVLSAGDMYYNTVAKEMLIYNGTAWKKHGVSRTDTVATLRTIVETPDIIFVTGLSVVNDGIFGSNFFKWDSVSTDTDNGSSIIKLDTITTGRYILQFENKVGNINTMTDLLSANYILSPNVNILGYTTANDGGGGLFNYDATKNKATANAGTIIDPSVSLALQGTGVGLGCWIRQFSGAVDVKWFGAKGDGVADDTVAIQSCINYVGGTSQSSDIIFEGTFKISLELQIGYANVKLVGSGSSGNHNTGEQGLEANTKFVWAGADGGNMVHYYSPDGVSNQKLIGGGISDIYFDSGATIYGTGASYGVILTSMDRLEFNNLTFREFQVKGILLTTTANLFDARDPQHNRFINCWNRNYINQDGGLVYLRGDIDNNPTGGSGGTYVTANVSLNHFENCGAQFYNGVAYELGNSDHNFFINCRANRITGGTGIGIKFRGSNNGLTMTGAVAGTETHDGGFVARKNIFIGFSGGSKNVASGTTSFTYPSFKNIFMMMDDSNGTPYPTIETGATCYVLGRTNGIGYYHNTIAPVFTNAGTLANAEIMALEARKRVTTESLRVECRGDGIRLARPSVDNLTIEGEWAMSTEATTNNLVIVPVAGNGCVELWSSIAVPVTTFTSSPTLTNLTSSVALVDATAANRAVGLPLANLVGAGRTFRIDIRRIDASANTCTVVRSGTDTLNGGTSELLIASQGKTYVSDGVSKWFSF